MAAAPTDPKRRRTPLALAGAALAAAVALLATSHEPPATGRLLFGGWRVGDVALPALLLLGASLLLLWYWRRRAAARAVLALVATGFAWAVAEAGNLLLRRRPTDEPVLGGAPLPNADVRGETTPDIAVAWGLPAAPVPFHFTTNAAGFRNPPGRDQGAVWCLGDSCLVAALLPWQATVVAQLEAGLAVPCVNVALIGKGPQEVHALFRALDPAPDLTGRVVLQFLCEDNDLLDSRAFRERSAAPATVAPPAASWWSRSLAQRAILALQEWTQPVVAEADRRTGSFGDQAVRFVWLHTAGSDVEREVEPILASLAAFQREVAARGGAFGVVLIPAKLRVLGPHCRFPAHSDLVPLAAHRSPLPERLAAWAATSGIAYLDLHDALAAAAAAGRLPWFADDTHWNATGAEVAARAVAAWPFVRDALQRPR